MLNMLAEKFLIGLYHKFNLLYENINFYIWQMLLLNLIFEFNVLNRKICSKILIKKKVFLDEL